MSAWDRNIAALWEIIGWDYSKTDNRNTASRTMKLSRMCLNIILKYGDIQFFHRKRRSWRMMVLPMGG